MRRTIAPSILLLAGVEEAEHTAVGNEERTIRPAASPAIAGAQP
jgi:hypothetical protein